MLEMAMADMEKRVSGPEKVAELSRNTTPGDGEVNDPVLLHADPNDGDEAYATFLSPIAFCAIAPKSFSRDPIFRLWRILPSNQTNPVTFQSQSIRWP